MGTIGITIAKAVPAPDKLGKGKGMGKGDAEPDMSDPEEASESGDEEAAELSAMEEFASALKDGSSQDQVTAFKNLLDTCKPGY